MSCGGGGGGGSSQNDPPAPTGGVTPASMVAANDSFSTVYQTILNGNISTNDTQSTSLLNSWELVSQASNGTTVISGSGTFTYTPSNGYSGNDSFTYQMRDSLNNTSNVATVTVSVQPQQVSGACDVLYANNGGFTPVTSDCDPKSTY